MAQLDLTHDIPAQSTPVARSTRHRPWAIGLLGLLVIVMGVGSTWDVKWHYAIGRDSFWIPPHILLYASVALGGLLCAGMILYETWLRSARPSAAERPGNIIRLLGFSGPLGLFIGGFGIATILLAAPFDDLWHRLYGIDVTIWSPPHMLGIVGGSIATLGGLVAAAQERQNSRRGEHGGHGADVVALLFLMGLVSLGCFILIPAYRLSFWPHAVTPAQDPFAPSLLFYPVLGGLLLVWPLIAAAALFGGRDPAGGQGWSWLAPLLVLVAFALLNLLESVTARIGFAAFVPWSDQTFVRSPAAIERALWAHPILMTLPTLALSLTLLRARQQGFLQAAVWAGLMFGLMLMLEALPIFIARNPHDAIDPATLALGFALAPALGAVSGAVGGLVGRWLARGKVKT
jgi:hypothetical protein